MNRLGIYSGTFDPVHQGHIGFGLKAAQVCGLDEVVFLPETQPREKNDVSAIAERIEQLQRVAQPYPQLAVLDLKTDQFTIEKTLPDLLDRFADAELTLLVGSDVVRTFLYRWTNLDILFGQMSLAIGLRQGDTAEDIRKVLNQLERQHNLTITYTIMLSPYADVTSSQFRSLRNIAPDLSRSAP
ncbi:MAG TPA: adenylyltransferase/cytidyltransferase family protein [Candidatus Saccharimonadales bacterium]|jgi:nicotinate-nucleotide adenylyltransferase|nr:adenylyltransferase/cytidyltransferase family protein [Candidatus Saccharimonadales bacterium]